MTKSRSRAAAWAIGAALGLLAGTALAQSTVTIVREGDTDRYDPQRSATRTTAEVLFMAGDTLVGLAPDMKTIVPGLAQSWDVSADGKTYTFRLRTGVAFCNGRPLTAADVVASYERWANPETKATARWRMGDLDKVVAVDPHTVSYRLKQPFSGLLYQMAQHFHTIIDAEQAKALGGDFGVVGFNGTGPFCFESWTARDQTVLTRNPNYNWGPPIYESPKPQVDRVVWKVIEPERLRVAALLAGQVDAGQSQAIPYKSLPLFRDYPRFGVTKADFNFSTYFIGMKIDREAVSDLRVRKAFNLAIDQRRIAESATQGLAEPAATMLAPGALDANPDVNTGDYGEDLERAARLLDEAGWKVGPDGVRMREGKRLAPVFYGFTGAWREIVEVVRGDLRKVGVDLQVELYDVPEAWSRLATQDFDLFGMSFPYLTAGEALNLYFRSSAVPAPNRMNWKDAETDRLLAAGWAALDDAARHEIYGKVQAKLTDAAVWIPLFHEPLFAVTGPKLQPVRAHGIYGAAFYKGLDLRLKPN